MDYLEKTDKYPVHEYLTEGSIIWLTDSSSKFVYKVSKTGYVSDHDLSTGSHKKGEWVSYGHYVAEVLVDNSLSDNADVGENMNVLFKYLGERAILI